ncbi:hypothetical protein CONCODRAFT_78214 [Conidiobolus coronatus NRRL 28638]|uniref:Mediator of RNA polymerase II transcription subunit 1 n=1 Tax=Conidiobolus coronatus (strain ATCC 28846 / CBS 209.66 / NRRL 28638) TaxID=796925 RepID=A0A137P9I5_CONC2|nr:hypothetical protein CONCODRAFT_78214 [Conidiobolus coronatus NRRL 28638]|eukprot:KXN71642.1 hypothetical protein CONCODRAFT_78214 [Conidiobolus coronatus NRRL 28638]
MTDPFKSTSIFNKIFNLKLSLKNLNKSNPFILSEELGLFPHERPGVDHTKLLSQRLAKQGEAFEEYGRVHWAHPLGPLDLDGLQHNIQTQLNEIREIIQAHTELIKRLLNVPEGETMPPTREIFNNLKNESLIGSRIFNVKHALGQVKYGLLSNLQPSQVGLPFYINSIERIAEESQILYYIEHNESVTITLSGHYIVIDIDLNKQGEVTKVKVSYAESQNEESGHKLPFFEDLAQGNMDSFRFNLKLLLAVDQLNYQFPSIDLFHNLLAQYNDFTIIHNQELVITNGDLNQLLNLGIGIPIRDHLWMGFTLVYSFKGLELNYQKSTDLIESSDKQYIKDNYYCLHITTQLSKTPMVLLPKTIKGSIFDDQTSVTSLDPSSLQTQPIQLTPLMTHPLQMIVQYPGMETMAAPLQFVMVLNPPIHCSEYLAKRIAQISGTMVNEVINSDNSAAYGLDSLQSLLIKETIELDNQPNYYGNDYLASSEHWIGKFKNSPYTQNYCFAGDRCGSYTLYRIPFQRLDQVYTTIQCLRQQIAFNRLFQSCFNTNTFRPWEDKSKRNSEVETNLGNVQIEVSSVNPPEALIITFLLPSKKHYITLNISISQDTPLPVVMMQTISNDVNSTEELESLPAEKLTQVLQICFSIPLLIKWILDRIGGGSGIIEEQNGLDTEAKKLRIED